MDITTHPAVAKTRPAPKRRARVSKVANARDTLRDFDKGREVYVMTYGQFSIMDAVEAVLEKTGPADVSISTWTAASADLSRSAEHLYNSRIRSIRFLVDRSFLTRQAQYAAKLIELFGEGAVRTTRSHAKFVTIVNDEWNVVMPTSMNLNENRRLEFLHVVDDAELCGFFNAVVDEVFAEEPPGLKGARDVPMLSGFEEILPESMVEMARGTVSVGA